MIIADSQLDVLQSSNLNFRVRIMPDWKAWTVVEAAEKTGYNAEYLRRLCRRQNDSPIEYTKIGRILLIKADSLLEYVEKMKNVEDGRYGPKK